jgi:hypothetical protein
MVRRLLQISAGLLTFLVGAYLVVFISGRTQTFPDYTPLPVEDPYTLSPVPTLHTFTPTCRACKPGYILGYQTEDGQDLREGVAAALDKKGDVLEKRLKDAKRVIQIRRDYRDSRDHITAERIILENQSYYCGEKSFWIITYEYDDAYSFIDAPSLELALEFEQFLTSTDYRAF